ncbi:hypothetical protein D3C72_1758880 [compost metagenome]
MGQLGPDLAGELAAGHVQGDAEFSTLAGEILGQLLFDLLQMPVVSRRHGITMATLQALHFAGQRRLVEKFQKHQPTALGHGDHRPQRRRQPGEQQRLTVGGASRGDVEGLLKRIAKAAQGFVA